MKEIKDEKGNRIYEDNKSIFIFIADKQQTRKLGAISPRGELFIRRYNKHIFRKLNAYGFNYNLISQLPIDMKVIVKEEDGTILETTIRNIQEKGIQTYCTEEFDSQIYLPKLLFLKK